MPEIPLDKLKQYLLQEGWVFVRELNKYLALWNKLSEVDSFVQLLVPKTEDVADYAELADEILEKLSGFETRDSREIIADIQSFPKSNLSMQDLTSNASYKPGGFFVPIQALAMYYEDGDIEHITKFFINKDNNNS